MKYDTRKFVEDIQRNIVELVPQETLQLLEDPPGRQHSDAEKKMSDWISSLDLNARKLLLVALKQSCELSIFSLLTAFDGTSELSQETQAGHLKVSWEFDGQEVMLASNKEFSDLNAIFRETYRGL